MLAPPGEGGGGGLTWLFLGHGDGLLMFFFLAMAVVVLCMTWKKAIIAFCRRTSLVIGFVALKFLVRILVLGAQLYLVWRTTVAVEEVHILLSLIRCFIFS